MPIWTPDQDRMRALARARAWYTGKKLETDSGTLFWEEASPTSLWTQRGPEARETRIHVPVAAELALTAADFLFGSGIEVQAVDQELDEQLERARAKLAPLLTLAADRASGLGEVYFRLGWDDDEGTVSRIDAAKVHPTWSYGRMTKAVVRHELPQFEGKTWYHYETYVPGAIQHELYQLGTDGKENGPFPLARHPETWVLVLATEGIPQEDLATLNLLSVALPEGLKTRLALVDVLNKEPRDDRVGGASDTDGNESLMATVDEAITSLQRDIRLGKARVIVDETMLSRSAELLKGMRFDTTAEIFAPLMRSGIKDHDPLKAIQFDIRAEGHLMAARSAAHRVVSMAGYDPESLVTERSSLPESAAARRLREARSLRTTGSKGDRWIPKIREILQGLMVIDASLENRILPIPELDLELREAVSPDLAERAGTVAVLRAAKVMSLATSVRTLHPDWDEAKIDQEVEAIQAEAPDVTLGGLL